MKKVQTVAYICPEGHRVLVYEDAIDAYCDTCNKDYKLYELTLDRGYNEASKRITRAIDKYQKY